MTHHGDDAFVISGFLCHGRTGFWIGCIVLRDDFNFVFFAADVQATFGIDFVRCQYRAIGKVQTGAGLAAGQWATGRDADHVTFGATACFTRFTTTRA